MLGIIIKLKDSIGEECGVGEIAKCKFREEEISVAGDFKRSHFLSCHFDDGDVGFGEVGKDSFL